MRPLICRGMGVDEDRWIVGAYLKHPFSDDPGVDKPCIIENKIPYEVKDETVGQYTGHHDTANVRIFENALIQNQSGRICRVVWHKHRDC